MPFGFKQAFQKQQCVQQHVYQDQVTTPCDGNGNLWVIFTPVEGSDIIVTHPPAKRCSSVSFCGILFLVKQPPYPYNVSAKIKYQRETRGIDTTVQLFYLFPSTGLVELSAQRRAAGWAEELRSDVSGPDGGVVRDVDTHARHLGPSSYNVIALLLPETKFRKQQEPKSAPLDLHLSQYQLSSKNGFF